MKAKPQEKKNMKNISLWAFFALYAVVCAAAVADVTLAADYESLYTGDEATGDHVIALWQFNGDAPGADVSGNGHDATLKGAAYVAEGRFGGALRSQRGWPDIDEPHQAIVKNDPRLTPSGAFTIEMWIQPAPEMTGYENHPTLMDKKYVADTDYQLYLSRELGANRRRIEMALGFGGSSQTYQSEYLDFTPGRWRHIAVVYDGAGSGRFFVDGTTAGGQTYSERRGIAPGKHFLSIGDRIGSNYRGFPGLLDQVRISNTALEFRPVVLELRASRRVFERMEPAPELELVATNLRNAPMRHAAVSLVVNTRVIQNFDMPELASG
ncbi:MAG TPA: LamG domain-containing protein, partial [Candidatus Hydrogenedentes bacterium]|nr:LamG domain-containing protein [Candidatus Hydrogenedentota bacterium]